MPATITNVAGILNPRAMHIRDRIGVIFFLIFKLIFVFGVTGQIKYASSGYTSLYIFSKEDINQQIMTTSPLSDFTPKEALQLSDTSYFLNFYTFGPTTLKIDVLNKSFNVVLLPNITDTLYIDTEGNNLKIRTTGPFHSIASEALKLFDLTGASYYKYMDNSKNYPNAVQFKNNRLERTEKIIKDGIKEIEHDLPKRFWSNSISMFFNASLFDYHQLMVLNNLNLGLDSVTANAKIPKRTTLYYEGLIDKEMTSPLSLLSGYYFQFIKDFRTDSLTGLSDIQSGGLQKYKTTLNKVLSPIFPKNDNFFTEMVIANAYIGQIDAGRKLSLVQMSEIGSLLRNKEIANYIFYHNERRQQQYMNIVNRKYLTYDSTQIEILDDILSHYRNKVVIIDFWATWCGPCIAAFDSIRLVKEQFKDNEDIVFVYITNESSNYGQWMDMTGTLSGEHYYLYNEQYRHIADEYGVLSIPSYLIFDKKGKLSQKQLGGYMGNEKLLEWIDIASKH